MKKSFLLTAFVITGILASQETRAQSNWELGARFGNQFSVDATIPLAKVPRLHAALYTDRFGLGAYVDWMYALSSGPTGLKFYLGVGPEMFFGNDNNAYENDFDFNAAGDFGVEYSFDIPLTIGFDWRPAFALTDGFDFRSNNWGFLARFRFGEGVSFKRAK